MLILALDTTTRAGSLALVRDDTVVESFVGDAARTHATRLPGDLLDCLGRHGCTLADVDLYGVAAGPGSFTGLRIGIATIQGLAFAQDRPVVAVSALDALAEAAGRGALTETEATTVLAWMDAQRAEVFGGLYRQKDCTWNPLTAPTVGRPEAVLADWVAHLGDGPVIAAGDGAILYADLIADATKSRALVVRPVPALAPAIARLARAASLSGRATHPHAIRPVYIRRPDAELARDRRAGLGG
jgi:tRNA threonylcarbamoyladenosine biosynthesis protein TsaB